MANSLHEEAEVDEQVPAVAIDASRDATTPLSPSLNDSVAAEPAKMTARILSFYILCIIMFLGSLVFGMTLAPIQQMVVRLVCVKYYENLLGNFKTGDYISDDMCKLPEIQSQASSFIATMTILMMVPMIFLGPIYGGLSDNPRFGRRPFISLPLFGFTFNIITVIIVGNFELSPSIIFVGSSLIGLCGGLSTLLFAMLSYTSDVVPFTERTSYFSLIDGALFLGLAFGPLTSSIILRSFSSCLLTVFYTALGIITFTIILFWTIVPPSKPDTETAETFQESSLWSQIKKHGNLFANLSVLFIPMNSLRALIIAIQFIL